jgi:hypothetical protein
MKPFRVLQNAGIYGDLMHVFTPGPQRREILRGKKVGTLYHVKITHTASRPLSTPSSVPVPTTSLAFAATPTHSWDK